MNPSNAQRARAESRPLARVIRAMAGALSLLGVLMLAAWATGQALTDRLVFTQFIYWVPEPFLVFGAGLLLGAGSLLGVIARRGMSGPACRAPRRIVWVLWCVCGAWLVFGRWHMQRWLFTPVPDVKAIRVVAWNPADLTMKSEGEILASLHPEVLIVTNPAVYTDWAALRTGMGGETSAVRMGNLCLVSVFRVRRWGWRPLPMTPPAGNFFRVPSEERTSSDGAAGLWVELDTAGRLGRPIVVWALDMPSNPNMPRRRVMQDAAAGLAGTVGGFSFNRDASGSDVAAVAQAFPRPDIVAGDFNTPRGSGSLNIVCPGMRSAFDDAGWGWAPSFPARHPLVAIDQLFLAPDLRATAYSIVDLGVGRHRAQVARIVPAR